MNLRCQQQDGAMGGLGRAFRRAASTAAMAMAAIAAMGGAAFVAPQTARALTLAQSPLYLSTLVKPNVLVVYDNSQSMDGTMSGKLIAGNDPSTRGNIARGVLRSAITNYWSSFNWGLESFGLADGPYLLYTYAYYFGSGAQVIYTNDCINGVSSSNGGLRCVANPEPSANGYRYITYKYSGDDANINDVLYAGYFGPQLYGIGINGTSNYYVFDNRALGSGTGWSSRTFSNQEPSSPWSFTPTDAGFLPATPPNSSIFWLLRAWGYYSDISGLGIIDQPVAAATNAQYNSLMAKLAQESAASNTDIKNAAVFTPLAGSLATAKTYFSGGQRASNDGTLASPITQSCQRNFVLLATDGNPTGQMDGSMYPLSQQATTQNANGSWNFSQAARDVFSRTSALRSTLVGSNTYDIQTYVVGLGSTVYNPASIATLNQIALTGGTGAAYLATDQGSLTAALGSIAVDIVAKTAASSAVAVNSGAWNNGTDLYQGRFNSGDWSGQLIEYPILASGAAGSSAIWDAGQILNGQNWDTGRQVVTYKPSAPAGQHGVAFRWPANPASPGPTEIDPGMIAALNTESISRSVDGFGSQRLRWIRGDTSREARNCSGCSAPILRNRPSTVLGDIVDSAPLYINGPSAAYSDTIAPASYAAYGAVRRAQAPMLLVGANDGMLHIFNGQTGSEMMAYVPYAVASKLSGLTNTSYAHFYTVDGSPAVGDAYYGGAWRSFAVSGMAGGAPGLFALDVSDPARLTEGNARSVVLWEIDSDPDVGYIYSKPAVVKLRDGSWRVLVGNGFNSTNGHAVLLLIDPGTGAISRIDTRTGSSSAPNGLSGVAAVSAKGDGVVDDVYAGDLQGNLWKFDLSSASPASWRVAYGTSAAPAALFTASAGQAITSRPDVTVNGSGNFVVTFGTGRYVDVSDNAPGAQQALYGIVDRGAPVTLSQLQAQSVVTTGAGPSGGVYRVSTHAVGASSDGVTATGDNAISTASYNSSKGGWYMLLPDSGERVVADATIRHGRVSFSTMEPSTAVCSSGGNGWLMELEALTGNRSPTFTNNTGGDITIGGMYASGFQIGSIPAAPTVIQTQVPSVDDALINTSSGSVVNTLQRGNQRQSSRTSWEQLQ